MDEKSMPTNWQGRPNDKKDGQAASIPLPTRRDLELRPELAAEFLEPDQIVAAKRLTPFGRKPLKRWERALLWILRVYVIAMQIVIVIAVIRALRAAR